MELPLVRTSDGNERKLYLQMIFASMFIEQKHGWSDILSGMPVFGIRESKKRIVEYILGLDTLKNEKERDRLNAVRSQLEYKWGQLISDFEKAVHSESCDISNLPIHPRVLSDIDYSRIVVSVLGASSIEEEIQSLNNEYDGLRQLKPLLRDNFDALNTELSETQTQILVFESRSHEINRDLASYDEAIKRLNADLALVNSDIRNNNDAARLQKFGSEATGGDISADICPVCKQHIQDNLLDAEAASGFMSMLATKGHPKRRSAGVHQVILSHIEEHSKKPDEARRRIVELMGDLPRIELFARQKADGWDAWGNEVACDIALTGGEPNVG